MSVYLVFLHLCTHRALVYLACVYSLQLHACICLYILYLYTCVPFMPAYAIHIIYYSTLVVSYVPFMPRDFMFYILNILQHIFTPAGPFTW